MLPCPEIQGQPTLLAYPCMFRVPVKQMYPHQKFKKSNIAITSPPQKKSVRVVIVEENQNLYFLTLILQIILLVVV